jgi:hypothetical protein
MVTKYMDCAQELVPSMRWPQCAPKPHRAALKVATKSEALFIQSQAPRPSPHSLIRAIFAVAIGSSWIVPSRQCDCATELLVEEAEATADRDDAQSCAGLRPGASEHWK